MKFVAKLSVWILLLIMQEEKKTEGYPRPNVYLHTQILYTYIYILYNMYIVQYIGTVIVIYIHITITEPTYIIIYTRVIS